MSESRYNHLWFYRRDILGPDGTLYLRRWSLRIPFTGGWRLMLHKIARPDSARDLHDHPWWFVSLIL